MSSASSRAIEIAKAANAFAYFLNRDSYDSSGRSAIGTAPGPGATEGGVSGAAPGDNDPSYLGYGGDMAITPTGSRIFLSNSYLQMSTGGAFSVFADGTDDLFATRVDAIIGDVVAVENMTITELAELFYDSDTEALIASLSSVGLKIGNVSQSLKEIAELNSVSPMDIFKLIGE